METVYIESSVVSHATSRDIRTNPALWVLQEEARLWWEKEKPKYKVVTSQFVLDEIGLGDPLAASKRLAFLSEIPVLFPTPEVEKVADLIIQRALFPEKARLDALHVASAAVARVQYLLTQNCRHIANAHTLPKVYRLLDDLGYGDLLICTPAEFLGDLNHGT